MPLSTKLSSLLDLCVANIARNMDSLWSKDYVETYCKEKGKTYLYVIGPFDSLPSILLVRILNALKEERRLRRHQLDLLITRQLAVLDLSRESEDVAHPLHLASIRCPDMLKILKLNGCQKISKQVYQDYLPSLTQLQVLDVSNTNAGDTCLFILGAYCKGLRELDVTSCPVSDSGIEGLCVGIDDLGKQSDRLGQCKAIIKLKITYTKVTSRGIQLALENLPRLKVLECCSSVQVLNHMHRTAFDCRLPGIPRYSLIDLHCTDDSLFTPYASGSLSLAVSACPSVIKIRIVTQEGMTDDDLLSMLDIANLHELSIGAGEVCTVTFEGGIAPVLQAVGKSLECLTLAELSGVNIRAIVEFCPNLRSLHLVMNRSYSTDWPEEERKLLSPKIIKPPPTLKKLESLHLVCVSHLWSSSVIPAENLPMLLSSPALRHIYIKDCGTLTDAVLTKCIESHRFRHLDHLELEQCNNVSKRVIDLLMNTDNPLRVIKLWECSQLSRQNVTDWQKKAQQKKWHLSLDWK